MKDYSRLYIKKDIYTTWKKLKATCLYSSDSAFAQHLLSLELRRQASITAKIMHKETRPQKTNERPQCMTSTPLKSARDQPEVGPEQSPVTIQDSSIDADVNITGSTFQMDKLSMCSDSSSSSHSEHESDSDEEPILNTTALSDALRDLDEDRETDSTTSSEDDVHDLCIEEAESESEGDAHDLSNISNQKTEFELSGYLEDTNTEVQVTVSDSACATTATDVASEYTQPVASKIQPIPFVKAPPRPSKLNRWEDHQKYQEELKLVQSTKIICSLDLLLQSFAEKCRHPECQLTTHVDYTLCGTSAFLKWKCPAGHTGKFCTSHKANSALANNLQASAAILLSGNNYSKMAKFADFLGLSFISKSTFYRAQRLYLIPAITEWWKWQQEKIFVDLRGKELVVSGDGQCDSPGFTAKNLCYFLMEMTTSYIIDLEVLDKREVDMKSVNMEKEALNKILRRLKDILNLVELVTVASASIKKLIATMFQEVFHSLDVWHKSKSIKKCLAKVGSAKGMEKINQWSEKIIKHFWHCCSVAGEGTTTDEEALRKMKTMWMSLLHHVCDEHNWLNGNCWHEELPEEERELPWFDNKDKDYEALQKIILEPTLLESFKYYTRFRHTGALERANSMSLMFASKRCAFTKKGYTARKRLCAIDWNYHLDLKTANNSYGETSVSRKYNQRTKTWNVKILKENKDYGYIWMFLAKIFRLRFEEEGNLARIVPMDEDDPRRIAPTIAQCQPVSSCELYEKHCSRFPQEKQT